MHEELISISIPTRQEKNSWTICLVVKFVFASEFTIETFFKGYSSRLKKLLLSLPFAETFWKRLMNFLNIDLIFVCIFYFKLYFSSEKKKSNYIEINVKFNGFATLK
jgi:hypothetical protein